MFVSFLDVASSAASSLRGSTRSRNGRKSTSHKSSSHSGSGKRGSRRSQNSSGHSQTTSTGVWTLSLSVEPLPRSEGHSEQHVPITAVTASTARHPFSIASDELPAAPQESPTDSLPMSVSDINFRVVDEEEEEVTQRRSALRLPRHPPLPNTPHSFTFPPSVQDSARSAPSHSRQVSTSSTGSMDRGQPYVAQTALGRRLAQARAAAAAQESQASRSNSTQPLAQASPSPDSTHREQASSGGRTKGIPFISFARNPDGS